MEYLKFTKFRQILKKLTNDGLFDSKASLVFLATTFSIFIISIFGVNLFLGKSNEPTGMGPFNPISNSDVLTGNSATQAEAKIEESADKTEMNSQPVRGSRSKIQYSEQNREATNKDTSSSSTQQNSNQAPQSIPTHHQINEPNNPYKPTPPIDVDTNEQNNQSQRVSLLSITNLLELIRAQSNSPAQKHSNSLY